MLYSKRGAFKSSHPVQRKGTDMRVRLGFDRPGPLRADEFWAEAARFGETLATRHRIGQRGGAAVRPARRRPVVIVRAGGDKHSESVYTRPAAEVQARLTILKCSQRCSVDVM